MKEKKQYMVTIEEMISQTFVITAEDDNESPDDILGMFGD